MAKNNHFLSGDPLWESCRTRIETLDTMSPSHIFVVAREAGYPFLSPRLRHLGIEVPDAGHIHGDAYLKQRIHPDDLPLFNRHLDKLFLHLSSIPESERSNYKYNFEYRWLDRRDKWVRIFNSLQILGFNSNGKPMELGTIDISPNQNPDAGLKFSLQNTRLGTIVPFSLDGENGTTPTLTQRGMTLTQREKENGMTLTPREKEVLELMARGMGSREISKRLFISIHTVNRHRQNILEKLDAPNALHAINRARELGGF